jgi:hypothetical protein
VGEEERRKREKLTIKLNSAQLELDLGLSLAKLVI